VRKEGRAVDRLHLLRGARDRAGGIADVGVGEHVFARREAFLEVRGDGGAGDLAVFRVIPRDRELRERGLRVPPGIGDHGHRGVATFTTPFTPGIFSTAAAS